VRRACRRSLRRGRELDVALATSDAIWFTRTTDGRRFTAAVPTIVPFGEDRRIAIADLDGDRRAEVVSSDASGRLMLLRAAASTPLARPVLPPSAPFITVNQTAYPVVSCTLGAGACIGSLTLPPGRVPLRLVPGARVRVRLPTVAPSRPGDEPLLRWLSPLIGAEAPLTPSRSAHGGRWPGSRVRTRTSSTRPATAARTTSIASMSAAVGMWAEGGASTRGRCGPRPTGSGSPGGTQV